jgi:hypothetical protein
MKKIVLLAAACAVALIAAGCRSAPVESTRPEKSFRIPFGVTVKANAVYINVWTDPDTGCQYLVTDEGFAQPRMTPDGAQACLTQVAPPLAQ